MIAFQILMGAKTPVCLVRIYTLVPHSPSRLASLFL